MDKQIHLSYWGGPRDGHEEFKKSVPSNSQLLIPIKSVGEVSEFNYYELIPDGDNSFLWKYIGVVTEDDQELDR